MKELLQSASGFNIVILCGGRGSGPLANQLLDQGARVTCLVNAYDDGQSAPPISGARSKTSARRAAHSLRAASGASC
jgi:hypothetical protein